MKNTIKTAAVIALSLFAAACAKVTTDEPSKEGQELHFIVNTAENAVVKSFIESNLDGTYAPQWSKDDELAIFVGETANVAKATGVLTNANAQGTTASFGGTITGIPTAGTFKSFAPSSAFEKGYSDGTIGINLASMQKPSSLTIDQSCDILVAKEAGYTADAGDKVTVNDLFFKRMFSVVKVALTGPTALNGEKVQKFSLTAPEGTVLAGHAAIDLSTATIEKWNIENNTVTATYTTDAPVFGSDTPGLGNVVWLVVNPGTIASGAKLTFAGETAGYTFSKEVTLSKDLVFPESQLAVINLTLADENCTKKATANNFVLHEAELVEGDYLVVYEGKAMKAEVASGRLAYADVKVSEKTIANSDASIVWHLSPSGDYWTILNETINKYAASTGVKNKAQLLADGADDKSLWTVTKTKNAATFEFVNKANSSANVNANLRNNGTYGFACYAATTGGPLSLYRLGGPVDNTVPTLSVDQTSKTWAADATDAFVVKVTVNSEGGDWTVTPTTLDWATIAVDKAAGTITVTPKSANTTENANEAVLTVAHASDASLTKEISLKQNAAAGGETPKTYTLQFGANYNDGNYGAYDKSWEATRDGFTWKMTNWNNNNNYNNEWTYVKAGRKTTASVATITTKTTIPEAISTVTMTIDAINATYVNSIKMEVISATGTIIETISGTAKQGPCVFNVTKPQNDCKYKITVDCKGMTGKNAKNGFVQVSKVVYTNN